MKKVNLCILLWGLLSSMPASGQSKFFSERQQKEKVQQELTYYREQAKQGDAKAKIREKRALELLQILENGGTEALTRTRAVESNTYTDTICNVNYSYNTEDGTAMVVSSDGNENVNILESFTVNGRTYTVTSIDRDAFVFSSKMLSIQIPQSIISIDEDAFRYNRNVSNIKVATGNPVFDSRDNCNAIINTETNTLIWGCKGTIIPNGIVSIGSYAFYGFESPENPIFPESVEKIGYSAFAQCDNLKELHIPATITEIDKYNPFWGTDNLSIIEVDTNNSTYDSRNNCNSIISTSTNRLLSGCMNSTIPEDIQGFGSEAFYCCSNIKNIHIPASVSYIEGSLAFAACSSLEEITVDKDNTTYDSRKDCNAIIETESNRLIAGCMNSSIPEGVITIGRNTFYYQKKLTGIVLPESVIAIEYSAFGSTGLRYANIPENVTTIEDFAFSSCYDLDSIASFIKLPFEINRTVFQYGADKGTLYVPAGTVELYKSTSGWNIIKNITELQENEDSASVHLIIVDDSGNDITTKCTVTWYDLYDKQIGTDWTLYEIPNGTKVYYSISLDEELGRTYHEIEKKELIIRDKYVKCQLERIKKIMLTGRVSAVDIDRYSAFITIRQMLNGKYEETFYTETDERGVFSIDIFDEETDITISCEYCHDATLHRDGFSGNGNIGTILMKQVGLCMITPNIFIQKAISPDSKEEIVAWTDELSNIDFYITNNTTGKQLEDFTIQNGNIIIRSGVSIDDNISITAISKQETFADATVQLAIIEGTNTADLTFTELGGVDVTIASSNNSSTIGYLYNSNGILVTSGPYTGETLTLRHLLQDNYTLVSMGQSQILFNLTRLEDFNSLGLELDKDYISSSVEVKDGRLTSLNVSDVPLLDDDRFLAITSKSYFYPNKSSLTIGNNLTLNTRIEFNTKDVDKINDMTITIDLPEGCRMVENSVFSNWTYLPYTINGNRLEIQLSKSQWQNQIRFCITPTTAKKYTLTAFASFDYNGRKILPIGSTKFEAKGLTIDAPEKTADTIITVNGTATEYCDVYIYDNDVLIGETTSDYYGYWSTECKLYKPFGHSFHNIYAKARIHSDVELISESRQVEYDNTQIVPKKVTMIYYNQEFDENYNIVFDLISGKTTPSYYYYFPYKDWPGWWMTYETEAKDFTFLADFTNNDSTQIKDVNIKVLNSDGTIRTLPATYDGKKNCWVANTKYSNTSRLPKNATIEYSIISNKAYNNEESFDDQVLSIINSASSIIQYENDNVTYSVIDEDGSSFSFEIKKENEIICRAKVELMDFSTACTGMSSYQYDYDFDDDGNLLCSYTEMNEAQMSTIFIDFTDSIAYSLSLVSDEAMTRGIIPNINTGKLLTGLSWTGNKVFGDWVSNAIPYLNIRSDLTNLYNMYKNYRYNLDYIRLKTQDLLYVKCGDGSNRLSEESIRAFNNEIDIRHGQENDFCNQLYNYIEEYKRKIELSVAYDIALSVAGGKLAGTLAKSLKIMPYSKVINSATRYFSKCTSTTHVAKTLNNTLELTLGGLITGINNIFNPAFADFSGTYKNVSQWAPNRYNNLLGIYVNLGKDIKLNYKECEKTKKEEEETEDEPIDEKSENKPTFPSKGTEIIQDPSGYVYEAVFSNRLPGVTTTVYKKSNDEAVKWNAENYSQQNPLITDNNGFYRWDVPQGEWQVKYEKEGYETTYSDWLPVPPPQLDVNVGMKQSTPPSVKQMRGYESGITIDMSKYMRPTSLNKDNIIVTCNGMPKNGNIELTDSEKEPYGEAIYASKMKFVPETPFSTEDDVIVTVLKGVESYCGVNMEADHVEAVKIEPEIKEIVVDSVIRVPYQNTKDIQIVALPKSAAANKVLRIKSSSSAITSISVDEIILDENGSATLSLSGELPGSAYLTFTINDTDVTTTSKVKVTTDNDIVATPTASLKSGETVDAGTQITLACDTEGATIYYTLDGTCPCDETKRIKYDNPIVINSDVVIKAMAIRDDMEDSDIATFVYIVEGSGLNDIESGIKIWPYVTSSTVNIDMGGNKAETITITGLNGMVVSSMTNVSGHVSIDLGKYADGIYIVNVKCKDDKIVRKIVKVGSGI